MRNFKNKGEINLFTECIEAKQENHQCLKTNQEIVAMTGDGVNDGPHAKRRIGILMGKRDRITKRLL
jgi:Ca2+-transporting ATPase